MRCLCSSCIVLDTGNTNERNIMYTRKMTIAELPEAVEAFISSGCDADQMRTLMDLIQVQTDYYQNRFWKMVGNQS